VDKSVAKDTDGREGEGGGGGGDHLIAVHSADGMESCG